MDGETQRALGYLAEKRWGPARFPECVEYLLSGRFAVSYSL